MQDQATKQVFQRGLIAESKAGGAPVDAALLVENPVKPVDADFFYPGRAVQRPQNVQSEQVIKGRLGRFAGFGPCRHFAYKVRFPQDVLDPPYYRGFSSGAAGHGGVDSRLPLLQFIARMNLWVNDQVMNRPQDFRRHVDRFDCRLFNQFRRRRRHGCNFHPLWYCRRPRHRLPGCRQGRLAARARPARKSSARHFPVALRA